MKKFFPAAFVAVLLLLPAFLQAQVNHFIYLQTENKQAFYAKIEKQVYSSSASGYLIIPKLKDGDYRIAIGFPRNETGEQVFTCHIQNDAGYLVKNFGDKGWGLFNLQTLDVVMAGSAVTNVAKNEKPDEFSNLLSEVVNDPSIKKAEKETAPAPKTVVKEAPVKEEEKPVQVAQAVAPKQDEPAVQPAITTKPAIEFISKQHTDAGDFIVYKDAADTIDIFIPAGMPVQEINKPSEEKIVPPVVVAANKAADEKGITSEIKETESKGKDTMDVKAPELITPSPEKAVADTIAKNASEKFLPIEMPRNDNNTTPLEQPVTAPMINSDCKAEATEEDFLKLRKKMAAAENDDDMLAAAHKMFKAKCFTTAQVKNLGVLFLSDAGRYRFFDQAYPFVSDSHNFNSLENQLSDPYYVNRFRAMVRH